MTNAERKYRWYHRNKRRLYFEEFQRVFHHYQLTQANLTYAEKGAVFNQLAKLKRQMERHLTALNTGQLPTQTDLRPDEEEWLKIASGNLEVKPILEEGLQMDDRAIADRIFGKLNPEDEE